MVIHTFKVPKLFFLHFLLGFAELFEGLVAVMTLGCVRLGISYRILFKLSILELELRKSRDTNDPWPRKQIWPPYRRK